MKRFGLAIAWAALATACSNSPEKLKLWPEPAVAKALPLALAALNAAPAAAAPSQNDDACPPDMVFVQGGYCKNVLQPCLYFLDPPGRYAKFRCGEYADARCASKKRVQMSFCIDRYEYTKPGRSLPENHESFVQAQAICKEQSKRLCLESEWNFACEGQQMLAYPYGNTRDPDACNADHTNILTRSRRLRDMRVAHDAYPKCKSPFGVRHLTGNLEEFVVRDGTHPEKPAMKGASWQPGRNTCRAAQTIHGRHYQGVETGFRCCADPSTDAASASRR